MSFRGHTIQSIIVVLVYFHVHTSYTFNFIFVSDSLPSLPGKYIFISQWSVCLTTYWEVGCYMNKFSMCYYMFHLAAFSQPFNLLIFCLMCMSCYIFHFCYSIWILPIPRRFPNNKILMIQKRIRVKVKNINKNNVYSFQKISYIFQNIFSKKRIFKCVFSWKKELLFQL